LFSQGLGLSPAELKAEFAPSAADLLDGHGLTTAGSKPRRHRGTGAAR
jgi:hypothetical protein